MFWEINLGFRGLRIEKLELDSIIFIISFVKSFEWRLPFVEVLALEERKLK
ncbi:MAG: hypothetical protein ACD_4C00087G0002 [uncultured bacterium (gcode 4)]|uniref:Uncharacterized protein n=1 Tax=uncultured bacterium (gcode 4) TaxID=1234023 RepID=K2F778_9BACT|nr:MAG: hypothetical protein ACD_4C00087G0002 [uncultured bacterium (gcode 4)]